MDQKSFSLPATMTTVDAAAALNRKPETLHKWSCRKDGPLQPIRINGRLAWSTAEIQRLLNGGK
jgi:hypothetical protein